jgi:hypothetical protein
LVVADNLRPQYDDSMEDEDDCSIVVDVVVVDERPKGRATGDDGPPHRVAVRAFAVVPKK